MSLTATLWDMENLSEPMGTVTVEDGQVKTTGNIPPSLVDRPMFDDDGQPIPLTDGDRWVIQWALHFQSYLYATVE